MLAGWDSTKKVRLDVYPDILTVGAISVPINISSSSGVGGHNLSTMLAELTYTEEYTGLNPNAKKIALEIEHSGVEVPINIVAADWSTEGLFAIIYPLFSELTKFSYFNLYWKVDHADNPNVTEIIEAPTLSEEPVEPVEPVAPVEPADPADVEAYNIAHAAWVIDHAAWVVNHTTWENEAAVWDHAVADTLFSFGAAVATSDIAISGSALTETITYTWLFDHNWEKGFKESLSWKTDIISSHNSTEQRIRLRAYPRRSWSYSYMLSGDVRRKFETGLGLRNVEYVLVPSSKDLRTVLEPLAAGTSSIIVENASFTDYAVNRMFAIWTDTDTYEVRNIIDITGDVITLEMSLESEWPIGAVFAPCRQAMCMDSRQLSRPVDTVAVYDMEFQVMGEVDFVPPTLDLYQEIAVCPTPINFDDVKEFVSNNWFKLDNTTGVIHYHIQSIIPYYSKEVSFLIFGLEEVYTFISFLNYCSGKLSPFWIQANDASFKINTAVASAHNYVTIDPVGYTADTLMGTSRAHIEIVTASGDIVRKAISSVEVISATEEKIMLTSSIGVNIPLNEIIKCSWLEKVRLDTDDVVIEWLTNETIKVNVPLITIP